MNWPEVVGAPGLSLGSWLKTVDEYREGPRPQADNLPGMYEPLHLEIACSGRRVQTAALTEDSALSILEDCLARLWPPHSLLEVAIPY